MRLKSFLEAKHGNSEISTQHTFYSTNKGKSETGSTSLSSSSSTLTQKYSSILFFVKWTHRLVSKNLTLSKYLYKNVYILLTPLFLQIIFFLHYQHQVLDIMRLGIVWINILYQFTLVNGLQNKASKTPIPPKLLFVMVSIFLCQLLSTLSWRGRHTKSKFENIIVYMVSTNSCPLWGAYLYVNWNTKFKCEIYICCIGDIFQK